MKVTAVRTRIFKEGENLVAFVREHIPRLKERTVLAVTSKIVALSERRTARPAGKAAEEALIRSESTAVVPTKHVFVTIQGGMLTANAGIDASNAVEGVILLPKYPSRSAARLLRSLKRAYRVKRLGIVITDSRTMPLRAGVTAVAIAYAGMKGLRDYRRKRDIFGRRFRYTQVNIPDSLATASALTMGEGAERQPLAIVEDAPVAFASRTRKNELRIPPADDMYGPLLEGMFKKIPKKH